QELVFEETSLEPPAGTPEKAEPVPESPEEEVSEPVSAGEPGAGAAAPALPAEEEPGPSRRTRAKARPKPEREITAIELASLVEPPPSFPDPRLSIAIAELRAILAILSRDPE
ncbi:MAG: hypothetical protein DYH06_02410, partial [Acidobacteria bacterium ACB2]|nr:hypothetical protein [Acidobacteria bacterium ACB2]